MILLVGNPNVGKSTLFNALTKSNEHTGNWHGVTVKEKEKQISVDGEKFEFVDLPGLYSLSPNSFEEEVSVNYVLTHDKSLIVNVCSSESLQKNLYLTTELKMLGLNVIVVINKMNNKTIINIKKIEEKLGLKVLLCDANDKKNVQKIKKQIIKLSKINNNNYKYEINKNNIELYNYKKMLQTFETKGNSNIDFFILKSYCQDKFYQNKLKMNNNMIKINDNYLEKEIKERYNYINSILNYSAYHQSGVVGKSKIDKILLNKYLCLPIFLGIMTLIFYLTFFSIGAFLSEQLRYFLQDVVGENVVKFLSERITIVWIVDLVRYGIFGGVGTIVSFLPQVCLMFLFLGVLEDCGYISRLAFCFDDALKKVGLSGKSIYTLLMGFGCSTTACLTARTMTDKNAKIKTAMLAPFMSCSAKLPVYIVIGGAFFGAGNIGIIVLLYLLGIVLSLCLSMFFEKTYLKSSEQTFIIEFPSYQKVSVKRIINLSFHSMLTFLSRVGSVLFALSIIVWILESFSLKFEYIPLVGGKSMLQNLGEIISSIFIPLGFASWGTASALLAGIVAKEVIVSSIAMFNNVSNKSENFLGSVSSSFALSSSAVFLSPASAISFMVFCLLYCPCMATISILNKEIGKKWTFILIIIQFVMAYLCSFVVYNIYRITEKIGILTMIVAVLLIFILVVSLTKFLKKKKVCSCCVNCKKICHK